MLPCCSQIRALVGLERRSNEGMLAAKWLTGSKSSRFWSASSRLENTLRGIFDPNFDINQCINCYFITVAGSYGP
jgi:hypothetical protein